MRRQERCFASSQGYLHEGHLSLVHHAKELCDVVVASIYVNPSQVTLCVPARYCSSRAALPLK